MLNSTCRLLSTGYKFAAVNNELTVRPCCLFKDIQVVNSASDLSKWRGQINKIDSYQEPACSDCNFLEAQSLRSSHRMLGFKEVPNTLDVGDPGLLEIQLSNTCNGGCIMCGPMHSSFWAQELKIQQPMDRSKDHLLDITKLVNIQRAVNIRILGGEPLLSDVDERIVDMLDDPSKVTIQFTTNGSIYPSKERIKRWEKIGKVYINFSVDGVGARFEYVRHPLVWETVRTNILRMQNEMPSNVIFKINHTVNILNLWYYDEFESWFNENFKVDSQGREWKHSFNPAVGLLSPRQVTRKLKDAVLKKYGNDQAPARTIETTDRDTKELLSFLSTLDRRRHLNWRTVFPEISNYI